MSVGFHGSHLTHPVCDTPVALLDRKLVSLCRSIFISQHCDVDFGKSIYKNYVTGHYESQYQRKD